MAKRAACGIDCIRALNRKGRTASRRGREFSTSLRAENLLIGQWLPDGGRTPSVYVQLSVVALSDRSRPSRGFESYAAVAQVFLTCTARGHASIWFSSEAQTALYLLVRELIHRSHVARTQLKVDNNNASPKVWRITPRGAREAVEHLIHLGHEDIAFVSGPLTHSSLFERHQGYRQAMEAHGLPVRQELSVIYEDVSSFGVEGGFEAATRLMNRSRRPTAVFAANDPLALGAMKAALSLGLAIPRDLSIVGFDDVEAAAHTSPPLTTVRVDKTELGRHAARLLSELIDGGPDYAPYKIVVCTELIVRGSTRPMQREALEPLYAD